MGKNSGHKAMQAQRYASADGGGATEAAGGAPPTSSVHQDADVSYHTPEWHAQRIASLTSNRMTWDDFKKQQREQLAKEDALVGSEKALREHRALLDAERAARLGARAAVAEPSEKAKKRKSKSRERSKSKKDKKKRKRSKDKKRKKGKTSSKKKRRRSSSSSGGSGGSDSSSGSSSDSSASSGSSSDDEKRGRGGDGGGEDRAVKRAKASDGPVKLSDYLRS